jgi:hypothetical protein
MSTRKWARDEAAESKMKQMGVKWEVQTIHVSDVNLELSLHNNARFWGTLDPEMVLEYGVAMERGDAFPMIIVEKKGKQYLILSGNHRFGAIREVGLTEIEAYVVEGGDKAVIEDMLPRVLNRLHGARQSRQDAITNALYFVDRYGYDCTKAAEAFGLPPHAVIDTQRVRQTRELLATKKVNTERLKDTHIKMLAPIKNENVLISAARVVSDAKMTGPEAQDLSKEIRAQKTEAAQMAVIAEYEKRMPTRSINPEVRVPSAMRVKFIRCLVVVPFANRSHFQGEARN